MAVFLVGIASAWAASDETQRRVQFNRGVVAFTQRDYSAAEQIFAELVGSDRDDVGSRYYLGLCRLQLNQYEAASQELAEVLKLAPDRLEVKLDAAIAQVGLEQFTAARQLLQEFLASGLGDATSRMQAQFFLGVAEYKTGNYEAGLAALAEAEKTATTPDMQANIAWYRAWIYTEQRKTEDAVKEFGRVVEFSTNIDQQARAQTLAEQVKSGVPSGEAPSQLEVNVDLGLSYDTNVVLQGDNTDLPVNLDNVDDFRLGVGTDVRFVQPVGEKWLLGIGGSTFNSWHGSLQEYNVQTYGGRTFVNYFLSDRVTLGLQYEYDYSLVENEEFLARHRLTPSVRLVEWLYEDGTPLTSSTVFWSYENRAYMDDITDWRDDRDGDYHSLGWVQNFNLCQPWQASGDGRWLSMAAGYRYSQESTQGDHFDMSGHGLSLRWQIPLPWELELDMAGQWSWEDYWQSNRQDFFLRNREDFIQRYVWGLSRGWELSRQVHMLVRGEVAWTDDDSNVINRRKEAVYSYDRVIYGLTLTFTFN
ncbi:MAG: hypothetical protein HJJLKODD_00864 [Phycisphaerae bacterium]|nr:hypothetical protein [Phycisphaerae bacterium]